MLYQFYATHRLSELTAAWGNLASSATSFGEKLHVSFSEVLSLAIHLSLVLTPHLSLSLFSQSFSRDHTDFFFLSETEKKLSSEVSTLKAELGVRLAELETERQTHQKEEKALRVWVVEAEKQRNAAVESLKNECKGIAGSFCFLLYSDFLFR